MKVNLQILLIVFTILLFAFLLYKSITKFEGLCDASCNLEDDCSGTDLSDCLLQIKCLPPESIKCVADFGTSVGDPLCCGQEGVLQDTRYVCPNTLKKCNNFKCGSAFGTCTS
jgi:hypothetical protein